MRPTGDRHQAWTRLLLDKGRLVHQWRPHSRVFSCCENLDGKNPVRDTQPPSAVLVFFCFCVFSFFCFSYTHTHSLSLSLFLYLSLFLLVGCRQRFLRLGPRVLVAKQSLKHGQKGKTARHASQPPGFSLLLFKVF